MPESGQLERAVNPLPQGCAGSNPASPTIKAGSSGNCRLCCLHRFLSSCDTRVFGRVPDPARSGVKASPGGIPAPDPDPGRHQYHFCYYRCLFRTDSRKYGCSYIGIRFGTLLVDSHTAHIGISKDCDPLYPVTGQTGFLSPVRIKGRIRPDFVKVRNPVTKTGPGKGSVYIIVQLTSLH